MFHIDINRKNKTSLHRQIYNDLRTRILKGRLEQGYKLPSTRELSETLGVSRNVVIEAYDQLSAEGFIETVSGAGTFVAEGAYLSGYKKTRLPPKKNIRGLRHEPDDNIVDFRTGVPDLGLFPVKKWGRLYKEVCENIDPADLDYYQPRGCYDLRYELSKYLHRSRGVVCDADQIFITTGAAQAFTLTARMLLDSSTSIIVEDPINCDILKIIKSTGADIHPISVDSQGIVTENLLQIKGAKLIFTTPSHQFPTGGILSAKRRVELIEYAEKQGGYIIEDDYDSEYRFSGSPISSLQSFSPERVIYVGTFSKKLFPALRIGYIVMPVPLVEKFANTKHLEDLHSPVLEQLTLSRFISSGLLERHISISKKIYSKKHLLLEHELKKAFGSAVRFSGNSTGIHLIATYEGIRFSKEDFKRFPEFGFSVQPIDLHTIKKGQYDNCLMLGYGNLSEKEIVTGVQRMQKAFSILFG